ncbi:glycosyl hydrolase [uncultured Winogradskyella sp.]|uniref:WD40/YVTN/BNR-like repeat-containing protein n=1 Tax=uncultured Winogradskyella sp. TaxID=395353 RepID=UPI0030D7C9E8|tara:strand:- start:205084 stop:207927 length:2844 start_codon:yes stop_codon:yes gene_type:complete
MLYSKFLSLLFAVSSFLAVAQQPATSAETIKKALEQKQAMAQSSLVKNVPFQNIGPTIMSGRVVDLDVNPDRPSEFYVGYASGGVWHTTNNGTTFTPILDTSSTQNVGDIAVHWPTQTIYVGTGENNASRSSYAGIGILKSTDNGKSWTNLGLMDAHHFAPILIHPDNPDVVVVGATGHLYSSNDERGIYKTTDGGKTWQQTLFVDNMSGIIDLQHSPNNYNVMFATSWTKDRKAWNFTGNGTNSGIYKSTDAGDTWTKVSVKNSGFPTGEGVGRIGIAVFNDDIVYAVHDSQFRRKDSEKSKSNQDLVKDDFKTMSNSQFLALDDKKLNGFLKNNGFQEKYRAENVKQMVRSGNVKPIDLAKYLEDANSMLFDTPVVGTEVYKSIDGGKTWTKTHEGYLDGIYYSYGYYFGHIHVSPADANAIYIYGVPIVKSKDSGKTWTSISAENVHADHHALWINPKNPNHLINGNDGGVNITYDDGENWIKNNSPSVGQFYAINVDNEKPYNVYGGLQDNGVWKGTHTARENKSWHQRGQYPWKSIMGGDGMQIQIDNRNSNIVYTGYQFGNYFRLNTNTGEQKYIQPKHTLGENPYRFNWQTPILLSPHNQDILYLGGNKLMRSMNQGNDWEAISGDLTNGGRPGNVAYGTLASVSESPFQFGLIYTGSDDGVVSVTKNAGSSWTNITGNLPKDLWVSRVIASQHKKERVYVTLNGYRWDDFRVYVYMSDNYGQTWKAISSGIPASPVNVIKEDTASEKIVYLGTDNGAYVSFNNGESWEVFSNGVPNVAVHDIVIQPEAKDLLLGTHGRSIYKADISTLQKMNTDMVSTPVTFFDINSVRHSSRWGSAFSQWSDAFEPEIIISFFSNSSGQKTIKILSEKGAELSTISINADKGFNYVNSNLELTEKGKKALMKEDSNLEFKETGNKKNYLPKGKYTIQIDKSKTILKIE